MRALATTAVSLVMLSASTLGLSAQQGLSRLDGVWRQVEIRVVRPDSTVMRPPPQGMSVMLNGHFAQIWVYPAQPGVQQASRPTSAEEKAARYDLVTANAGTIEVHDSTFIIHYQHAKGPATENTTGSGVYRLVGDSLWAIGTSRWAQDTSKVVRTTTKYVRQR